MNSNGGGSSTSTPNFDNLLLQSLMSRLQIRSPNPLPIEDLLFSDMLLNLSDEDDEYGTKFSPYASNTQLAKEESRLEKEIVRTILNGETEKLKPNSGQAVTIGQHHICVGFNRETGSEYRVWEWHGHIMLFDEENGYTPEYIYGNYFEMVDSVKREMSKKAKAKARANDDDDKNEEEEKVGNVGLKELIGLAEPGSGHVLHRNLNASPRF